MRRYQITLRKSDYPKQTVTCPHEGCTTRVEVTRESTPYSRHFHVCSSTSEAFHEFLVHDNAIIEAHEFLVHWKDEEPYGPSDLSSIVALQESLNEEDS
jgi:hypothetical protein